METLVAQYGHCLTVVAPVPYFPRLPFRTVAAYDRFARVPYLEEDRGYAIYHPRYLLTPKFGMRWYSDFMVAGVRSLVHRIHRETPIDLIDAHYVFPDGTAASEIANSLKLPLIISARGTDLNLFPSFPAVRRKLLRGVSVARRLICVSEGLRDQALAIGVPDQKISVIGNGVDTALFNPGDREEARAHLHLDPELQIIFSAGNLVELKGFHLIMEAFSQLALPNVLYVVAGQGPMGREMEDRARNLGLGNRVRFLGPLEPVELAKWYQAADLFALASSREGWPNVLTESQACGLPAVGTRIPGIAGIVRDSSLGILVERDVGSLKAGLAEALKKKWNRKHIAQVGGARSWHRVAEEVESVFQQVLRAPAGGGGEFSRGGE